MMISLIVATTRLTAASGNVGKGLPAIPSGPIFIPASLLNIAVGNVCVYVIFNEIMLSLQNFYGVSACRNAL
jgi:hypothetical protein